MNLFVEQGATYTFEVEYKDALDAPIDLTGFQGRGQIRLVPGSSVVLGTFVVTIPTPEAGLIRVELEADALEGIALPGKVFSEKTLAVYDIELYAVDRVIRLVNGTISISPEVTK